MFHIPTNVAPWKGDAALVDIDAALVSAGSTPVVLPFDDYGYIDDGVHFTRRSQRKFHKRFARLLVCDLPPKPLLVLTDSTVDFHDWTDDGMWTGWASADLAARLNTYAADYITVDAIGGSGFVAGAHDLDHFYARLSRHLRAGHRGSVLFMGGWNDAPYPHDMTRDAIRGCKRLLERFAIIT